ncbi:hypothetical protein DMI69_13050 [Escherichia coli]|nr:hypothetical protein [Escherichia coli]
MARFDIDTGGYPVQRRAKIAGCGFNLPDIRNPLFREPELKLYRRIINRKMRRGGYLKIPGVSSICDGAAGAAIRTIPMPDRPAVPTHLPPGLSACNAPAPVA